MAPASSAQREPSMEEILASIRRIIEDNDTGKKQPVESDDPRQDHDMPDNDVRPMQAGTIIEVDAFRAELRGAQAGGAEPRPAHGETFPMRSQIPDATEKKPVTLAEVQAQIASETSPRPTVGASDGTVFPDRRNQSSAPKSLTGPAPKSQAVEPVAAAAPTGAVVAEKPEPASVRPSLPDNLPAKPGIISERAERQVAAAFGELSEAFASRAQKSFDELAVEMMRPMLRDWLDNNLPVLVEKLVREEIERVARGA